MTENHSQDQLSFTIQENSKPLNSGLGFLFVWVGFFLFLFFPSYLLLQNELDRVSNPEADSLPFRFCVC